MWSHRQVWDHVGHRDGSLAVRQAASVPCVHSLPRNASLACGEGTETEPRSVCTKRRPRTSAWSRRPILRDVYLAAVRTLTASLKVQPNWASGVAFADSGGWRHLARSGDTSDPRGWGGGTTGPAGPWAASCSNAVWPKAPGVRGGKPVPCLGPEVSTSAADGKPQVLTGTQKNRVPIRTKARLKIILNCCSLLCVPEAVCERDCESHETLPETGP